MQLECLLCLTKIITQGNLTDNQEPRRIIQDAIGCAKTLSDSKTVTMCYVNLGVIEGTQLFDDFTQKKEEEFPSETIYNKDAKRLARLDLKWEPPSDQVIEIQDSSD